VVSFNPDGSSSRPPFDLAALTPDAFAVAGNTLLIGSNAGPINQPVPSAMSPIGPIGANPTPLTLMSFGKFLLNGMPDHDIDADLGYLVFESGPITLNISSAAGAAPFQVFGPQPDSCCYTQSKYIVTPSSGVTPAAVTIGIDPTVVVPYASSTPFLLVSPMATQPIEILPSYVAGLFPRITATVVPNPLILPPGGGPVDGVMQVRASAISLLSIQPVDLPTPFQFQTYNLPSFLKLETAGGTTPADVVITALDDSLPPGAIDGGLLIIAPTYLPNAVQSVSVLVERLGPPPPPAVVSPTSLYLSNSLTRSTIGAGTIQITPASLASAFQVGSVPQRLQVQPTSGTGASVLTVTADFTRYPIGTTNESFVIQVDGSPVTVTVGVSVAGTGFNLRLGYTASPAVVCPGLRATIVASGSLAGLPSTGSWSEVSPAPTDWNGYSFLYNGRQLPIISADANQLSFEIQFPYDLDLTSSGTTIDVVAGDGTIFATVQDFRSPQPASIGFVSSAVVPSGPVKPDGTLVSADNPVRPGDTIRLSVAGTGVTGPVIDIGVLPDPGAVIIPAVNIRAAIGGKPASVSRQALSSSYIGVTDLDIVVPNVAPGLQMLGLATPTSVLYKIPVWVAAN
jgi:uncharacterized protein (TIGR03437 family)